MAHRFNSWEAKRARAAKGAYKGHATTRASGRVPGQEARAAALEANRRRRLAKALAATPAREDVWAATDRDAREDDPLAGI